VNLNHVHLAGPDGEALAAFYERWFGFRRTESHDDITFLRDDAGFLLAVDSSPDAAPLPTWFHVGFCLDDPTKVRDLFARMKAAGVSFARELMEWDGEAVNFYALDPGGHRLEVSWYA
jgi:catechol 2,3-dioxygenase-like lactoylglutathione lyase family enzyme